MEGQLQHYDYLIDQQSTYRKRYTAHVVLSRRDLQGLIWLFQQYCQEPVILIDGIQVRGPHDLDRFHYPLASSFHATGYLFDSTHPATGSEPGAYIELHVTQTQAEIIVPSTLKREAIQAQTLASIDSRSKFANFVYWIHRKFSRPSPLISMITKAFRNYLGYPVSTIVMNSLNVPSLAKYLLILPFIVACISVFIWVWDKFVKDIHNTAIILSLNDFWSQQIAREQKRDIVGTILLWITFISLGINLRILLDKHVQWFAFLQTVNPAVITSIFGIFFVSGLVLIGCGVLRRRSQRYQEPPQVIKTLYFLSGGILVGTYGLAGFIFYSVLHL